MSDDLTPASTLSQKEESLAQRICELIIRDAELLLGRPLSDDERARAWELLRVYLEDWATAVITGL